MNIQLSIEQIQSWLKTHQKRLRAKDDLPAITEVAKRAGVHRDTVYAAMNGNNIHLHTQILLSRAIRQIEEEYAHVTKTNVMTVTLGNKGAELAFGVKVGNVFQR